eukprot:scaffold61908_cov66-Phaeocystis_antarctica.AAC.1
MRGCFSACDERFVSCRRVEVPISSLTKCDWKHPPPCTGPQPTTDGRNSRYTATGNEGFRGNAAVAQVTVSCGAAPLAVAVGAVLVGVVQQPPRSQAVSLTNRRLCSRQYSTPRSELDEHSVHQAGPRHASARLNGCRVVPWPRRAPRTARSPYSVAASAAPLTSPRKLRCKPSLRYQPDLLCQPN